MAVTVSTVAWQAAGRTGMLPSWMGWYGAWTAGWRVALALVAIAAVVAALWWISVTTASKYEARISKVSPELNPSLRLSQPGFWKGEVLVRRQRALHSAAALAAAALIAALSADRPAAARWVAVGLAAAVLAVAAISVVSPLAERYKVTMAQDGDPQGKRAEWWCWGVLAAADDASHIQVPFDAVGPNVTLALETGIGNVRLGMQVQPVSPAIFVGLDGTPILQDAETGLL